MNVDPKFYDLLDKLAGLKQQDLESHFSKENVDLLRQLSGEILGDENYFKIQTPFEFADSVYKLREAKRVWARRLGDAIIGSSDFYDKGDKESAIKVLEDFIQECPSPFYRENAETRKDAYRLEKIKKVSDTAKIWGRKAGNALADAFECLDKSDREAAITILDDFIKICPIESHKKDAQSLKEKIISKQ